MEERFYMSSEDLKKITKNNTLEKAKEYLNHVVYKDRLNKTTCLVIRKFIQKEIKNFESETALRNYKKSFVDKQLVRLRNEFANINQAINDNFPSKSTAYSSRITRSTASKGTPPLQVSIKARPAPYVLPKARPVPHVLPEARPAHMLLQLYQELDPPALHQLHPN